MLTQTDIEKYFTAEKQTALAFIITGCVLLVFAVICWLALKTPAWKGAAIPAVAVGLLVIIAGYTVYNRSDEQRISNVYALSMNPDQLQQRELPRIEAVNKQFRYIHIAECILLLTGSIIIAANRNKPESSFWFGFGGALTLLTIILLVTDIFAAQRASQYTHQLKSLLQQ
ncbi:hypothetical protein SAMN05421788_1011334 [Filimonas lacunae]|uniref:Uncharacterized protein n=1 Tax=Filimonas lacunae TaxID=477680 RepID=A0A173MR97_9BACT|nr:hypothetical protein [Filimonas lacunae]BAV09901.1 hypothetical protein FLA_5954 [Filimonas lacunae]SIS80751.1 hypothetical protein SAMN05421788_1011334 [Filimonas lacunae]